MHLPFLRCARGNLFGIYGGRNGVAFVVGLPRGFAFRPLCPWLRAFQVGLTPVAALQRSPVNSPSRGTLGVISMAFWKGTRKTVSESVRRVCYTRHILPMGVFSLYAARSGRYRLCVGELYRVRRAITGTRAQSLTCCPLSSVALGLESRDTSPDATDWHPFFGTWPHPHSLGVGSFSCPLSVILSAHASIFGVL
ncbi:hypothetical protein EDB85DRAFT_1977401, partial [Lactarius pseudohatsudake]